jgi:starch-binding outer membrane protein SusE/F
MNKKILNIIVFAIIAVMGLIACDDRNDTIIDTTKSPIVVDLSTSKLILDSNFPKNPALTIFWDATQYTVPTEIQYRIEVSSDDKFTKPFTLNTLKESIRSSTFTAEQMNTAAVSIGLVPYVEGKMYIRVISYLGSNNSMVATSNITSLKITPYKLSYPDFYLVGEASYVGWNAGASQILYKSDNFSTIYTYLENGKNFRFLGQQGWDGTNYSINSDGIKDNYKYFKQASSNIAKADGDDENMKFSGTTGIYKVTIDATSEIKSITAVASPISEYDFAEVYLVGNIAGNGWDATNAISMTKVSNGVYEFVSTLASNTEFKIIGQKSFGSLDWGNISGDGNSGFIGPKGDNGNIIFVGDGSSYKITVNLKAGVYTIKKQ